MGLHGFTNVRKAHFPDIAKPLTDYLPDLKKGEAVPAGFVYPCSCRVDDGMTALYQLITLDRVAGGRLTSRQFYERWKDKAFKFAERLRWKTIELEHSTALVQSKEPVWLAICLELS
jgi:hypothetical protein